jgi:hypothetical protein
MYFTDCHADSCVNFANRVGRGVSWLLRANTARKIARCIQVTHKHTENIRQDQPVQSLVDSVEHDPPRRSPTARQEIIGLLLNPKVRYRVHNSPPTLFNLSQINPVHILSAHFINFQRNFILSSISSEWSHPFRLRN